LTANPNWPILTNAIIRVIIIKEKKRQKKQKERSGEELTKEVNIATKKREKERERERLSMANGIVTTLLIACRLES
jgi:biopolymer transport protein ExbB/TolQ